MHGAKAKNPGLLSARVGGRLLEAVDRARAGRLRHDGKEVTRTDATIEALGAWSVGLRSGAYYPTERERVILDGLRARVSTHPEAVDAWFSLAEAVARDSAAADALERLVPLVVAYAAQIPGAAPVPTMRVPRRRPAAPSRAAK